MSFVILGFQIFILLMWVVWIIQVLTHCCFLIYFSPDEVCQIKAILLCSFASNDSWFWWWDLKGGYSVKSGYKALVQDLEGGDTDGLWTWAWGLHMFLKKLIILEVDFEYCFSPSESCATPYCCWYFMSNLSPSWRISSSSFSLLSFFFGLLV